MIIIGNNNDNNDNNDNKKKKQLILIDQITFMTTKTFIAIYISQFDELL